MMYELRPYQKQSITECRNAFKQGHKEVILMSPTGSGKSVIIREIIANAKTDVLFVVHRKILIKQMKETLKGLNVEIATLQKVGKNQTKKYGLVIHDECHYSFNSKLRNNLNFNFYLGLSATPFDSYGYPLKCDKIISFLQMPQLIELGYAAPFKVLSVSNADTSSLKSQNGDYNNKQAFELMSKSNIKRNILEVYEKYCKPKDLKTVVYAVNIHHAEQLQEDFTNAGVKCELIHSRKKTDEIIKNFKDNKFRVLINVSILTIGFDDGDIEALLLASPTKSKILAQQIYGRVSRLPIKSNKKYGLILDCANVVSDAIHPMETIDMSISKEDKGVVKCTNCKAKTKLINRTTEVIDQYEYVVKSTYKCPDCEHIDTTENYKIINRELCEDGTHFFEPINGLQMKQNDKSLNFNLVCKCGFEKKFREVLYTDEELKEITLQNALNSGANWDDVLTILKHECKQAGYKWQYSTRLIDSMKAKRWTPKQSIENIKTVKKMGKKISTLMYI